MGQEDKFKKEIDRIGILLAGLMDILLHRNTSSNVFSEINQQLQSELDINLEQFLLMNDREDVSYLTENKHFSLDHLRVLGDILYELAYRETEEKKQVLKKKALILYEYINANHNGTLYYDLQQKIRELKSN